MRQNGRLSSFFLVHYIDKDGDNEVSNLHKIPQEVFTLGMTRFINGNPYISGIEPPIEYKFDDKAHSGAFSQDISSIWLGVNILSNDTFEENINLYQELKNWARDTLYLIRFLLNLNLSLEIFFHCKNEEVKDLQNFSIQEVIDLNCDSGSYFTYYYNRYELIFPLLCKLLQYKPSDKFYPILYNYSNTRSGHSLDIAYFYSFATLEGVISNWAKFHGYSELWGKAIADSSEQQELHINLRSLFEKFIKNNKAMGEKRKQLVSFLESTFPKGRFIRRSLRQRLKSYLYYRLSEELQENRNIRSLMKNFGRIYSRRNEIGHSLEDFTKKSGFVEDVNTLMSCLKHIFDYELNLFITGEVEEDWKFEKRPTDLSDVITQKKQENVLDYFYYTIGLKTQKKVHFITRSDIKDLETVKFTSKFILDDNLNLKHQKYMNIYFLQNFNINFFSSASKNVFDLQENPYWWVFTEIDKIKYVFKIIPPREVNTIYNRNGKNQVFAEISSEDILLTLRLQHPEINEETLLDMLSSK